MRALTPVPPHTARGSQDPQSFCSFFSSTPRRPPPSTLFPYTTLFRSPLGLFTVSLCIKGSASSGVSVGGGTCANFGNDRKEGMRSEEHTSELQSRSDLVCRLLLEKKKARTRDPNVPRRS